jgi:hypothetical protein
MLTRERALSPGRGGERETRQIGCGAPSGGDQRTGREQHRHEAATATVMPGADWVPTGQCR